MEYRIALEKDYRDSRNAISYIGQTFQNMYERAARFFRQEGHLGDYSKEALEKNSEHYMGKAPKHNDEASSNYKLGFNSM